MALLLASLPGAPTERRRGRPRRNETGEESPAGAHVRGSVGPPPGRRPEVGLPRLLRAVVLGRLRALTPTGPALSRVPRDREVLHMGGLSTH